MPIDRDYGASPCTTRGTMPPIGMAVLTLRRIHRNPGYVDGDAVKISRRTVRATIAVCNLAQSSNRATDALFNAVSRGLPRAPRGDVCPPPGALLASDRLT